MEERRIYCPYCNEPISILVNSEDVGDAYIEDCQVCCRPIEITLSLDDNHCIQVQARDENDV